MNATKRAQVPFGLRKKLMAATSMLLVAAIMLVSTSYAWFTLSTAPEITGITTSVGANGNLEIALLNNDTYADENLITSNTGDSMETQGEVAANITWGNLIDLSDASYGLGNIKMYPSALNGTAETMTYTSPLKTPAYGADGRVTTLEATTTTAVYDGTAFATPGYGVRAVGVSSNVSPRQLAFTSAKANFSQASKSAQAATKSAVTANATSLLSLATGGGTPASYTYAQVENMEAIAVGVQSSLNSIVSAYASAIIAAAAAPDSGIADDAVALLNSTISGMTSATGLIAALSTVSMPQEYAADLEILEDAQADVAAVIAMADALQAGNTGNADFTATSDYNNNTINDNTDITESLAKPLIGGASSMKAYDAGNKAVSISGADINTLMNTVKAVYIGGGAVKIVADYTGTFKVTEALGVSVYTGVNADGKDAAGNSEGNAASNKLKTVSGAVNALNSTFFEGASNISDFYGYIIDFAFRTNAASSNLLLQTEAANRVYSNAEGENLATMGSGSFGTFDYTGLTFEQGKNLLESYRVVFFNPVDGTIYGTAKFGDIPTTATEGSTTITGKLQLISTTTTVGQYTLGKDAYEVETEATADTEATYKLKADFKVGEEVPSADNCTNYVATGLTATAYENLAKTTVKADDVTTDTFTGGNALTSLPQNQAKKVSMLVYLDGNNIDNAAVNAVGSSGSLDLNVQFASDANLVPMENSALKNKTVTAEGGEVQG